MTLTAEMKVSAIAPYFGSNRMLAPEVGRELSGCSWVGVVFAGGMSEVAHIKARTLLINDLHRHVMNMAEIMASPVLGPQLYRRLRRKIFHPDELKRAQIACCLAQSVMENRDIDLFSKGYNPPSLIDWAEAYFIAAWMPRHGSSGTSGEFNAGLSIRWNSSGGDSAAHFWGATRELLAWRKLFRRANFTTLDFAAFLDKCKDEDGHGIYSDAPFPGPGDAYTHTFGIERQRELARRLATFKRARVVVRFYDIPLIRELYPEPQWTWRTLVGRKQTNALGPEVLILNGPSRAERAGVA